VYNGIHEFKQELVHEVTNLQDFLNKGDEIERNRTQRLEAIRRRKESKRNKKEIL
jgi:hypothetical protein